MEIKRILMMTLLVLSGLSIMAQSPKDLEKGKEYWGKAQKAYAKKYYYPTFKNNKKSAELGYPRGMVSLAICYNYGIGTQKDYEKAIYWFKKAMEHPEDSWAYPRAFFNLADNYVNGNGVAKDISKAAQLCAQGINNFVEADYGYGYTPESSGFKYWYGYLSEKYSNYIKDYKDFAYVFDFFETKGYGKKTNSFPFERSFEMGSDFAIEKVKALVESGNKEASISWANYLYNVKGTSQDKATAIALWEKNSAKDIEIGNQIGVRNMDGVTIYYVLKNKTELAVSFRGREHDTYSNEYSGVVTIPESITYNGKTYRVTSIGKSAFRGCSGLTSITIPNSVTSIGEGAFARSGLLNNQPDGVIYIDKIAYGYKGKMPANTKIVLKDGTKLIASNAFSDCTNLTSITIPNSVTSIGNYAFQRCSGLTSITIPNSVKSIGGYAFLGCSGLTSITIPNSVKSIGNYAFLFCSGLTSITIPNSVTSIENYAFSDCSGLTSITIPNSVKSIGERAFSGCSGLTSITIPNSVTSIGDYAFQRCSGLTSITIPNSVKSIGTAAFYKCSNLKKATVPSSLEKLVSSKKLAPFLNSANSVIVKNTNGTTKQSNAWYWFSIETPEERKAKEAVQETTRRNEEARLNMSMEIDWERSEKPSGKLIHSPILFYDWYEHTIPGKIYFKSGGTSLRDVWLHYKVYYNGNYEIVQCNITGTHGTKKFESIFNYNFKTYEQMINAIANAAR